MFSKTAPIHFLHPILLVLGISQLMCLPHAPAFPLRAGYEFASGVAWSADVDLPNYEVIDLGKAVTPLAVGDSGVALLRSEENQLIRWRWGQADVLIENFSPEGRALLNEMNTVVAQDNGSDLNPVIRIWHPLQLTGTVLDFGNSMITEPHHAEIYALNDWDELALMSQAEQFLYFPPPNPLHIETNIASLAEGTWTELSLYEYHNSQDFVLTQGGREYTVHDLNNYGDTIGYVYEDHATSSAWDPEPAYTFQNEYFSLNIDVSLNFEPLQINDQRTILGRTTTPPYKLVILDQFGQRRIGTGLVVPDDSIPQMSNPSDGLEEIVMGIHYWKRMTERNQHGLPTRTPAPDFWQGELTELIREPGLWSNLEATCISANGRIAGKGWYLNPETFIIEDHGFMLAASPILPDWNRDGSIDSNDRTHGTRDMPWRFWINDDDDSGDLARSWEDDSPDSDSPDWESAGVDGLRDVVDFFPVLLDLQKVLQGIDDLSEVELLIRHPDDAFNFTYTDLHPEEVGRIHTESLQDGFGPDFNDPLDSAQTQQLTADGIVLSDTFLQHIQSANKGVLLLEARKPTLQPITIELRRNGTVILSSILQISIGPVADMFRIINLRNADPKFAPADPGPWPTRTDEPPNLPDGYLADFAPPLRTLVHIHGYNWTGDEVPAAHGELFKRFYQSGSHARFVGVTWRGDEGTLLLTGSSMEYNENVINAFISAKYVAGALAPFAGPDTTLFAHSLGNMVASSAIHDFGLEVGQYFMVNAAVPREAYFGETPSRRLMVHPDWKSSSDPESDYPEHLLSPNWYRLFEDADNRSFLKWKERFGDISNNTTCINYYSTGEDVLAAGNGELPGLISDVLDKEKVWTYNEMIKGVSTTTAYLTSEVHGGWGFNHHHMDWLDIGGPMHPPPGTWVKLSPSEAETIPLAELISEPFFRPFSAGDDDFPAWGYGVWLYEDAATANSRLPALPFTGTAMDRIKNHAKVVGEAIPAHSASAGCLPMPNIPLLSNVDLNAVMRIRSHWPDRGDSSKNNRWLHSDYMQPALSHVAKFYRHCIESLTNTP